MQGQADLGEAVQLRMDDSSDRPCLARQPTGAVTRAREFLRVTSLVTMTPWLLHEDLDATGDRSPR